MVITSVRANERTVDGLVVAKKMAAPGWVRSRTSSRSLGFGAGGFGQGRDRCIRGGKEKLPWMGI